MATRRIHRLSAPPPVAVEEADDDGLRDRARRLRELVQVLVVSWLVRAAFIAAVPYRVHSADIDRWITVTQQLRAGANPYATTTYLNWPPLWLTVLWLLDHIARGLGISFLLALQLFLIAIESVVVVVLHSFLARIAGREARRILLVGISLNPVAILLVCQHGNFDVLVGLLCLGGALALVSRRDVVGWLAAALAFGLGALAKTVPLALAPLLARGGRRARTLGRVVGAGLFLGPALLGVVVIYVLAPHAVLHNVVLYRSEGGWFGLTGIADLIGVPRFSSAYSKAIFPVMLLLWIVGGFAVFARRRLDPQRVILLAALVLLAIPTIGPGFAPQYAYWWLPLLIATYPLFDRRWRALLIGLYAVAAATYVVEASLTHQYPWFLEAAFPSSHFVAQANHYLGQSTWSTVLRLPLFLASLAVLGDGLRRLRAEAAPQQDDLTPRATTSGRVGGTRAGRSSRA